MVEQHVKRSPPLGSNVEIEGQVQQFISETNNQADNTQQLAQCVEVRKWTGFQTFL